MAVEEGDFVKIHYTGRVKETDEVIDTTREEVAEEHDLDVRTGPVVVVVGAGMVWEPVEEELKGREPGDEFEVEVPPEKAFGERDASLVRTYRRSEVRGEVRPGGTVVTPEGRRGRVVSVDGGRVRVDMNHPLAGKTLVYEVEVLEVLEGVEERAEGLLDTLAPGIDVELEWEDEDGTLRLRVEGEDAVKTGWFGAKRRFVELMREHDDRVEKVVVEEVFK